MKNVNNKAVLEKELTLDPTDWSSLKKLGNEMVNDMIGFLQTIREKPVWQKPPEQVKNNFRKDLPQQPTDLNEVYE
jgi:hypothetical protein